MSALTTCAACGAPLKDGIHDASKYPCEVCGSTKWITRVTVLPIQMNLSAFAFQWYGKDFYEAYNKVKGGARFSPARLTLLAQAVELAAKSLHVDQGKQDDKLRRIGHNLVKACDPSILSRYKIKLTAAERTELKKMNDLNESKAFEYFWFLPPGTKRRPKKPTKEEIKEDARNARRTGIIHAVTGRKGLPDESVVERLLIKLLAPKM
jgi:hypothetical protein